MDKEHIKHKVRYELALGNFNQIAKAFTLWREYQQFTMGWELVPEKLMLIVTEAAEAMEAYRHNSHSNFAEEIADIIIRVLDLVGGLDIDIQRAIEHKMEENFKRPPKHNKIC